MDIINETVAAAGMNPEQKKFPIELFSVPSYAEVYLCPICQMVPAPDFAAGHAQCGAMFCADCINVWLRQNETCPKCREPLDIGLNKAANKVAYKSHGKLVLKCPQCAWEGEMAAMEMHRRFCPGTRTTCKYAVAGCAFEGNGAEMITHEAHSRDLHLALCLEALKKPVSVPDKPAGVHSGNKKSKTFLEIDYSWVPYTDREKRYRKFMEELVAEREAEEQEEEKKENRWARIRTTKHKKQAANSNSAKMKLEEKAKAKKKPEEDEKKKKENERAKKEKEEDDDEEKKEEKEEEKEEDLESCSAVIMSDISDSEYENAIKRGEIVLSKNKSKAAKLKVDFDLHTHEIKTWNSTALIPPAPSGNKPHDYTKTPSKKQQLNGKRKKPEESSSSKKKSPYTYFLRERMAAMKQKRLELSYTKLTQCITDEWRTMNKMQREPYAKMAEAEAATPETSPDKA